MRAALTAEQHTDALMEAVDRELDRYGAASLIDFISAQLDPRCDTSRPAEYAY